jgi:hypothetical protein
MRRPDTTHDITCYFRAAEGIGLLVLGTISLVLTLYLRKKTPY